MLPRGFPRKKIISLSNAQGYCAVYMTRSTRTVFSVPLVGWALVDGWDEQDWIEDLEDKTIIGMVLSTNPIVVVPAAEAEFVESHEFLYEDPAWFCGYLSPGDKLDEMVWEPIWEEDEEEEE